MKTTPLRRRRRKIPAPPECRNARTDDETSEEALVQRETRDINILRLVVLILLITVATLASVGVYLFSFNSETQKFEDDFDYNARLIMDSFQRSVGRELGAVHSMSTSITSFVLASVQEFPFLTIPHFVLRGSDLRIQADALLIHWMPLVKDENREAWEEFTLENRGQIDEAFVEDAKWRIEQDMRFGLEAINASIGEQPQQPAPNETVLTDGSGFHPRIWSTGGVTPRGDEPDGGGPFLPLWQRSPVNGARQVCML